MSLTDISIKFTEDVLDEIIQKAGGTKHTSYEIGGGFKKGDSYLSQVFRVRISGINESKSKDVTVNLIVKAMPDNLNRRKVFRSADFFRNEINFYKNVIDAWEEFQGKQQPKNPFVEYPICYGYHCDGENDFIALGDVTFENYYSPNRQEYITLEKCLLTMRTLGRFHGISLALKALQPEKFENVAKTLEETYYAPKHRTWYVGFLEKACRVARDAVSAIYPNTKYETIAHNFLQISLYDEMIQLVSTRSKLSVFGHGDCWTPNFLMRYKETGEPEAIKIIDFQLARCSSLAVDLSFFIYSCTSQELREEHYEKILREYHNSACALISDLGADPNKIFSWLDFMEEMRDYARFGCGMGIESLPMSLIEDDEVAELDEIAENTTLADVWDIKPFKEANKQKRIADIFKHAIDQGYIQ